MELTKILKQSIFVSFFILGQFCFQTQAAGFGSPLLAGLKDIAGEYKGEIRLQDSVGAVDKLLVPDAKLRLDIQKDMLVARPSKNFMGKDCQPALGGIRELMRNSGGQPQILAAAFDYDTSHCPSQKKWNTLLLYLNQESDGNLVLQTLLARGPVDLSGNSPLIQNLNVHGFFTKEGHLSISKR